MPSALTAAACGANGSVTPATSCPVASCSRAWSTVAAWAASSSRPVVGVEHDAGGLAALAREPVVQDVGRVLGLDAGHPLAVVELAAGGALQRRRWRRRPPARRRAPGTGAGRCCGRGGTGMRSRGPPGVGPAACGTTPPSRSALTRRRAGAEGPRFSRAGATSSRSRPRSKQAANASAAERRDRGLGAPDPRRRAGTAGTSAPASARRRSACPSRTRRPLRFVAFGGDRGEHDAAGRGGGRGGRAWGRPGSGTGEDPPAR